MRLLVVMIAVVANSIQTRGKLETVIRVSNRAETRVLTSTGR